MSDTFSAISDLKGHAGQPVSLLSDGRVTLASDSAFPAIGLGTGTAAVGHPQLVRVRGELKLSDWTRSAGTTLLVLGATYYLSPVSGQITTTATGQRIGEAITRTTLLISIATVGGAGDPHSHVISDVTGLQSVLDAKAAAAHTHPISEVTGLQTSLDGKAATAHGHTISDVTSLQSSLDGKAATSHAHPISDVTNLQTSLDGKAASVHGHAIADVTNLQTTLNGKAATAHSHVIADTTNLQTSLDGKSDVAHTHAGLPIVARIPTADATQNSNVNFTNLFTRAILASEVWSFEAIIYWFSAAGTTGIVTQVDAPASPTFSQLMYVVGESATVWRSLSGTVGVPMVGTASATAAIISAYLSGTIENGPNNGNLVVKFRSEVNTSLVTVKRGSWCRFYKH